MCCKAVQFDTYFSLGKYLRGISSNFLCRSLLHLTVKNYKNLSISASLLLQKWQRNPLHAAFEHLFVSQLYLLKQKISSRSTEPPTSASADPYYSVLWKMDYHSPKSKDVLLVSRVIHPEYFISI